jgi:hypothetical protein
MYNVAATVTRMGINNPTPAVSGNGTAKTQDQPAALSLSATVRELRIWMNHSVTRSIMGKAGALRDRSAHCD